MSWLSCIISNVLLASLLALAAWFVQRRLERHAIARTLWVLVLVKLITPPLVSLPLSGSRDMMACQYAECKCGQHVRSQSFVRNTLPWLLLATWLAGAGATFLSAWRRWTHFRRLIAHARAAPPQWQSLAARLTAELSIRCPPELLAVPGRISPMVVPGRRRTRLLLPIDLMGRLNAPQKTTLLLHELIHIKRGDHLVRMLEFAVGVAYWWLPAVGSIGRQLRACEEVCCDAAVVAHLPQARRDYAQLLLDVLDFASPLPRHTMPQATAMSAANDLEQRLHAILGAPQATRCRWPAGAVAVGLACVILPCKLHFEFIRRDSIQHDSVRSPAAPSAELEPAAGATRLPSGDRGGEPFVAYCCPS